MAGAVRVSVDPEDDDPPESGPFCRHWSDPGDCQEKCGECGHWCGRHDDDGCDERECGCLAWVEPE